jgi:hypothetical protein
MQRRAFLQTLAAAAAGLAIDPEQFLWRPGAKTIFLPPTPVITTPVITTLATGGFRQGDVITIEWHWSRNPTTGRLMVGQPQTFVVTADVTGNVVPIKRIWPTPDPATLPPNPRAIPGWPGQRTPFAPKSPRSGWVR